MRVGGSFSQMSLISNASVLLRLGLAIIATTTTFGCAAHRATVCDLDYCDDIQGISYQRNHSHDISHVCLDAPTPDAVATTQEPRNLQRRIDDTQREITLHEALTIALSHNKVIETSALGGVATKAVLQNPQVATSVYDPAIQSSGVLFGRRSVEAALADFDAQFTSRLTHQRRDLNGGSLNGGGNRTDFTSSVRKQFATGGSVSLHHDWTHTVDPSTYGAFTPNYFGRIGAQVRQPLLAGSGVAFTRIAGPSNPNFGSITGVSQGVVVARINQDISQADFELAVRSAMLSIENAYWDLYLAYRVYDTAVVAHQSGYQTWKEAKDRLEVGVLKPADELQARDQLYETKAAVETSLNSLYKAESELRRLTGLPMNDGTVLVPSDTPAVAKVQPDWSSSVRSGLTHRVELRRQKWNVKSIQLQLQAARTLVRPRLDMVAGYDIHPVGERLLSSKGGLNSALGSITHEDINSWNVGLEMSVPIGFRFNRSQVRNLELQLAKANAVLASQQKNITHDIATAFQDLAAAHAASQSNYKRLKAATGRAKLLEAEREVGTTTLDLVLRAQRSLAAAESSYYTNIVAYNKAIAALNLSTGQLLENHSISLAEGPWDPAANGDALLRAHARTHAVDAPHLSTQPADFASQGPTGTVELLSTPIDPIFANEEVLPPPAPASTVPESPDGSAPAEIDAEQLPPGQPVEL